MISLTACQSFSYDGELHTRPDKNLDTQQAISALTALAQASRLAVYRLLVKQGPAGMPASRISEALGIPASSLSFHLKELTNAGMVTPTPDGRFIIYAANFPAMDGLITFLTENCCADAADAPCAPGCALAEVET
jgi:ArsR family transcriptional regulator